MKAASTTAATKGTTKEGATALMADTRQTKLAVSGWELEGISISGQVPPASAPGPGQSRDVALLDRPWPPLLPPRARTRRPAAYDARICAWY